MKLWGKKKNEDNLQNKIDQLYQHAQRLYKRGQYKEAIDTYDRLSRIVRQKFGENNPDYALSLNNLALVYLDMGDYGKAEALFQKVLIIERKLAGGENHPDYATTLNNLALVYLDMRDFRKAEPLYQKALEIQRILLGENHEDYANTLNNLAGLYSVMRDFRKAEPLYQKALEIRGQTLGQDHPGYANTMYNLASLYKDMGDYGKAEALFQKVLIIERKVLGENHPNYATIMHNLAKLYYDIGDYTKSEPLYQKALEIRRKVLGENHPQYAETLNNLALMYQMMGDYGKAEALFQKVLDICNKELGQDHPGYGITLSNLASLYQGMGDYGKAEALFQKVLIIERKVLGENHPDYANTMHNLALLYVATSRQVRAFNILREFVIIEDKTADQVFSIASDRQRMAFIGIIQATFYSFLSLVIQQFSQDQEVIQNALDLIMRRKSLAAEAISVQREIVLAGKYPQSKSIILELNNIRRQISRESLAGPLPGETLDKYNQNLQKLDSKKEQLEKELARQIPEIQIQQSLKTINSKTVSNSLPDRTALIEFVRFYNYNFYAIHAKGDSLWQSPRYLAFILRSKELDNVQMIDLGDAESIDDMVTRFRISIIEAGAPAQANQEKNQDDGRHVVALDTSDYSSYHNPNNNASLKFNWKEIGYQLYELIFHPLLSNAIGEDCEKLFIAPDGDLTRLPFEVLPTSKDDSGRTRLLIEDYSITYLTTARDVLQINKISHGTPNESIVAADPDFDLDSNSSSNSANITNNIHTSTDNTASIEKEVIIERPISNRLSRDFDRSTINFNRLQGTKYEGQEIAELFGVQPWTAEKVLESRLKSFRSPRILHIATHGFFLANQDHDPGRSDGVISGTNLFDRLSGQSLENPMLRSGLALAGANTWINRGTLPEEAEDGILTAEDVSMMDLSDTELVVLSACETGLGDILTGEGVFGLRRSFVLAGAKTLVMSLWKVPDEQTKELMVDFYKGLLSGKGRADALREAQLAMKKKYPNPYYWGAFICQGNPGPLSDQVIKRVKDKYKAN